MNKPGYAFLICVLCLIGISLFLDVRPDIRSERFIGHADEADTALVARSIAEGRGPILDVVRFIRGGGVNEPDISHRERYSSIYVPAAISPFFYLFGANRTSLLLAASVAKALMAALAAWYLIGRTQQSLPAIAGACTILFQPCMLALVCGLTDIYVALIFLLSLILLAYAIQGHSLVRWIALGLAVGVAIGFKPTSLLLLPLVMIVTFFSRRRQFRSVDLVFCGIATVAALIPLGWHNYQAAGTLLWPDLSIVSDAMYESASLGEGFENDGRALFSSNGIPEAKIDTLTKIKLRLNFLYRFVLFALQDHVLPSWLVLIGSAGLWQAYCDWKKQRDVDLNYEIMAIATLVLFCGGCFLALSVSPETRYWTFLLAPFCIVTCASISRARKLSPEFGSALLVSIALWSFSTGLVHYRLNLPKASNVASVDVFNRVDSLLPRDAKVMTSNPAELAFHTRRRAVMVPFTEDLNEIESIAKKYGTEYFLVVNQDTRPPWLRQKWNNAEFPDFLRVEHKSPDLIIARFQFDQAAEFNGASQ